jgi:hypothetical protein
VPQRNDPPPLWSAGQETPAVIIDDPRQARQQPNLAKGVVWADILADIAADAVATEYPEAA